MISSVRIGLILAGNVTFSVEGANFLEGRLVRTILPASSYSPALSFARPSREIATSSSDLPPLKAAMI
jgi:hypothetical protein